MGFVAVFGSLAGFVTGDRDFFYLVGILDHLGENDYLDKVS